jgi:hypothetical protein
MTFKKTDPSLETEARRLALRWFRAKFGANHPEPTPATSSRARMRLYESLITTAREEMLKVRAAQAVGKRYAPQRPNYTLGDYIKSLLRMVTNYHQEPR